MGTCVGTGVGSRLGKLVGRSVGACDGAVVSVGAEEKVGDVVGSKSSEVSVVGDKVLGSLSNVGAG